MKNITRYIYISHYSPFFKGLPGWFIENKEGQWKLTCNVSTHTFEWLKRFETDRGRYDIVAIMLTPPEFEVIKDVVDAATSQKSSNETPATAGEENGKEIPAHYRHFLRLREMHFPVIKAATVSGIPKHAAEKMVSRMRKEKKVTNTAALIEILKLEKRL